MALTVPASVKWILSSAATVPAKVALPVVFIVSTKASLNLVPLEPKSTSLSVCGANTPSPSFTCVAPATLNLIKLSVSKPT